MSKLSTSNTCQNAAGGSGRISERAQATRPAFAVLSRDQLRHSVPSVLAASPERKPRGVNSDSKSQGAKPHRPQVLDAIGTS